MKRMFHIIVTIIAVGVVMQMVLYFLPETVSAQEEVASAIRRYKQYEASTGYYEEYEVLPPTAAKVRIRTRLADSHQGIKFYQRRRCEDCHIKETKDIHTVRANLTCRQCHGGEPIASIDHYFSPMNPIRKHAFVCAKCHQGASASYASYIVHTPNPALAGTRATFPVLYYVFWIMVAIAVGTFVVFLPHTILWGIRELFVKQEKQ